MTSVLSSSGTSPLIILFLRLGGKDENGSSSINGYTIYISKVTWYISDFCHNHRFSDTGPIPGQKDASLWCTLELLGKRGLICTWTQTQDIMYTELLGTQWDWMAEATKVGNRAKEQVALMTLADTSCPSLSNALELAPTWDNCDLKFGRLDYMQAK